MNEEETIQKLHDLTIQTGLCCQELETVLNYIENSIPKKVVEEKMVIDIDKLNHGVNGILSKMYKARIILEKELLEGK